MVLVHVYLLIAHLVFSCVGHRILVAFPFPSKSHSILGDGVVNALAKANHQVTYITPYPKEKVSANIREIDVSANTEIFKDEFNDIRAIINKEKNLNNLTLFITRLTDLHIQTIESPNVQKYLNDPKEQFDVVIVEWLYYELFAGLAAVYNCPYIWLTSTDPHWKVLRLVDEPSNPAYTADGISSNVPPFTFLQRVQELAFQMGGLGLEYFNSNPVQTKAYEDLLVPIIHKRGNIAPEFHNLIFNASLVLSNSHVSIGKVIRLPQNFIPIGGYHISRDVKPLPEHLKKLLDNAKNGVIYFSMGSNVKSKFLPDELKQSLLQMFSELKYTVLWKFEEDLPVTPNNVHVVQWAPQQSILAHPNCILFMTHGGLLSLTEAVHFGKPIIAIPVFADQFNNANLAVTKGFGMKVDLSYTMADDIKIAIKDVLGDTKYAAKARELSMIYHDRPVTPDKELVHWVEHVVKTRGARHLRSPALDLAWYQKLYLDLVAIVIAIVLIVVMLFKRIISYIKKDKKIPDKKKKH